MKEVSSKVCHAWFAPIAKKGLTLDTMIEGTSLSVATLQSKSGRLDWAELCTIHRNLRPHFSDDELLQVGRSVFRPRALRFMFLIGRLLLTPLGFYRWMNTPRQGAGNQMMSCVSPRYEELSDHECRVQLTLPEGYEPDWTFFLLTKGGFEELPRLLGYGSAVVRLDRIPNGGLFHITIPTRAPFSSRFRRALTWPFTARAVARELKEANETLVERYEEIERAHKALERQKIVLDIAYRLGERIWGTREPGAAATAIVGALVDIAGFEGASIEVATRDAPQAIESATAGRLATTGEPLRIDLASRGHVCGEIRMTPRPELDLTEAQTVVDLVAPTIGLALDNAFAYRALDAYRVNLEKLVDERTAELREASNQLALTIEQLQEAKGVRERFFGNISHEIRTPLSLILLAAGDIEARAGGLLDERGCAGLGAISESTHKLVRLVDELLLLAAGQEDKLQIHREPTDLAALVGQLIAAWRPPAEAAGIQLVTHAPTSLLAFVDPVAIERVATNLVSNAIKYTPRGARVEVELSEEAGGVRLSVLDDGPGIAEELASRLFGRFERSRGDDRRKVGTGIGLALVKELVEAHGGSVQAIRRAGGGTEIRVILVSAGAVSAALARPASLQLQAPEVKQLTSLASGARFTPPGVSAGTIVLAEDDAQLAEMIARLLAERYTVFVALDGAAALELVRAHQPHLLVTDVDMPELDGIALSRKFREVTGDALSPIIILSAIIDLGTRVSGLEAGAIDYVTKPFDARELRARVDAQFRMRDLALRLQRAEQLTSLGILTAGLAHEIRNPANGIINAVAPLKDLLPRELTGPDTSAGQLLSVLGECAEQVAALSRQLLSVRDGGAALELRPARVADLVRRALVLAKPALEGVDLRIELELELDVMCAPPLLVQVLTNLIENAAHAAGRGGWVEVSASAVSPMITVQVADSGPGIPSELRQRVFEPFYTTKAPGSGTGLGLSVARAIMHRHGGVLEIRERQSRPTFVIELPDTSQTSPAK